MINFEAAWLYQTRQVAESRKFPHFPDPAIVRIPYSELYDSQLAGTICSPLRLAPSEGRRIPMKVRTLAMSFLALAFAGIAPAQEAAQDEPAEPAEAKASTPAPRVALETSLGTIVLELNEAKAPATVKNFLSYVDDKFYDGTIFHRVIGSFMIQGGGFELVDGVGTQKEAKDPIKNEAKNGLSNVRGSIAMARTNAPDSATCQFFINVVDNANLDPGGFSPDGYAVFGKVVDGMEVVDKIKAVQTGAKRLNARHPATGQTIPQMMRDVPVENVVIKSARRVEKK